ncbi:MFS transporter [Paenibacillus xylaniclasticus]|uniref:MFS transporter n=1 Tax=Paenibacillus xylaniclasticus TaxID=588083 RepID=UPI0017706326|nr:MULTISPECIES: MFS transporter [Paenibacillus]GFN31569.1 MFS transporter [Paenibacillus curdlanolyticus]
MTDKIFRWFDAETILFSAILFLVEFIRGAGVISFMPIYGEQSLGLSLDVIGVAVTAHYITDTVLKLIIGYLLDRLSARIVVQVGLFLTTAGIALLPYSQSPWLFITASALFGIGISPIWIVCLTRVSNERRATQMGYLYTIWFVGLGAGPIIANIMLDYSTQRTFLVLLIMSIAAFALSLLMKRGRATGVVTIPFRQQLAILQEKLRQMKLLLPGMILQTIGASMLVPVLPSFASESLGLTGAEYSLLLLVGGGFTVAALMPLGRLSDKLGGKKWFLVFGFAIFAIALYSLAFAPSFGSCLLLAAALGLSYAAVLPAWNALLASYVPPKQQGLGWGIFSTVEGLGVMIGPIVGGIIASQLGQPSVVWYSAALFGLIGLFYLWFPFHSFTEQQSYSRQKG